MFANEFLPTAQEAARKAGGILQEWAERFTVKEKNPADLVTEADIASQAAIYDMIHARFPDHDFLGEEGAAVTNAGADHRWIVDPLDGTSNYVHHFPFYAVSIGLEHRGEMIVGVVYDPNRDELFSAVSGGGATCNGKPLATTAIAELRRALVVASLPVAVTREHPAVQQFLRVLPHAQHIQRTGSAAMNLAYVACGRIEAFWSRSLNPWDMAAGVLLVAEAGGRVSRMDGRTLDLQIPDLLASNGTAVHEELQRLLTDA